MKTYLCQPKNFLLSSDVCTPTTRNESANNQSGPSIYLKCNHDYLPNFNCFRRFDKIGCFSLFNRKNNVRFDMLLFLSTLPIAVHHHQCTMTIEMLILYCVTKCLLIHNTSVVNYTNITVIMFHGIYVHE